MEVSMQNHKTSCPPPAVRLRRAAEALFPRAPERALALLRAARQEELSAGGVPAGCTDLLRSGPQLVLALNEVMPGRCRWTGRFSPCCPALPAEPLLQALFAAAAAVLERGGQRPQLFAFSRGCRAVAGVRWVGSAEEVPLRVPTAEAAAAGGGGTLLRLAGPCPAAALCLPAGVGQAEVVCAEQLLEDRFSPLFVQLAGHCVLPD